MNLLLRTRLRKVSTATGRWFQGCGTAKCQNLSAGYLHKRHKGTKKMISVRVRIRKKTQKFTSRDCLFSADLNFTSVEELQSNLFFFLAAPPARDAQCWLVTASCKAFLTISGSVSGPQTEEKRHPIDTSTIMVDLFADHSISKVAQLVFLMEPFQKPCACRHVYKNFYILTTHTLAAQFHSIWGAVIPPPHPPHPPHTSCVASNMCASPRETSCCVAFNMCTSPRETSCCVAFNM